MCHSYSFQKCAALYLNFSIYLNYEKNDYLLTFLSHFSWFDVKWFYGKKILESILDKICLGNAELQNC